MTQLHIPESASESYSHPNLHIGTSSWTAKGWLGTFYPSGTKQSDFIAYYSRVYDTVEIDATFYAVPKESTIVGWRDKTPDGFTFSAKAPQTITHEKFLDNCEHELHHFLSNMAILGEKLGPILFQFPYFAKKRGVTEDDFLHRLQKFVPLLPKDEFRFAVEVRNKNWLNQYLFDILRDHGISLALIDHPWMTPADRLITSEGLITADFAYIRWLGDRYRIEEITKVWNETVVDRANDIKRWVEPVRSLLDRQLDTFIYVNNHYGGYAPDNIEQMKRLLAKA